MPLIVCDRPAPAEAVKYYTLVGLPGNPQSPISTDPQYGVKHDVTDLPTGTYNLMVSACNDWKCSLATPFSFTVPVSPSQPSGFRLVF